MSKIEGSMLSNEACMHEVKRGSQPCPHRRSHFFFVVLREHHYLSTIIIQTHTHTHMYAQRKGKGMTMQRLQESSICPTRSWYACFHHALFIPKDYFRNAPYSSCVFFISRRMWKAGKCGINMTYGREDKAQQYDMRFTEIRKCRLGDGVDCIPSCQPGLPEEKYVHAREG